MSSNTHTLRDDALAIWQAGVAAVSSERLISNHVQRNGNHLSICGHDLRLDDIGRIVVVGAGKAGAGMAAALEHALGENVVMDKVAGWVNVPADCVGPLQRIHLHPARPAGVNEPTTAGVEGTRQILAMVADLKPNDVCVVLLSGGGSALLPAPVSAIRLEDKQAVTQFLMRSGATINELNCVRKQLSQVKGGGLARASRAGLMLTLIISDVIGDPLDVIASGPTVANSSTAADALDVLRRFDPSGTHVTASVWRFLTRKVDDPTGDRPLPNHVHNHVIGNNAVALEAAERKAHELGYGVHSLGSDNAGVAREVGIELAELCLSIRDRATPLPAPACILSGGEPIVNLIPTDRSRKGGRNQELVLAACRHLQNDQKGGWVILSGGTDGEDGPTDGAGAVADQTVLQHAREKSMDPDGYLAINNSYPFFEQTGGLIQTGPTHTNVMDLRVCLVSDVRTEGA